jgi:hypothetical protein
VVCPSGYLMTDGISRTVIPSLSFDGVNFAPGSDFGAYHPSLAGLSSQIVFIELDQASEAKASMRGVCVPTPPFP